MSEPDTRSDKPGSLTGETPVKSGLDKLTVTGTPAQSSKDVTAGLNSSMNSLSVGNATHQNMPSLNGGANVKQCKEYSGETTPKLEKMSTAHSSGSTTPAFSEQVLQMFSNESLSWVVKLCVRNILPRDGSESGEEYMTEPLPVRLESLQVMSNLTKGYFPFIR